MRRFAIALIVALALTAAPAVARRAAQPGFAEPGDIIAAEGNFTHLSAAKGISAAIRATAAPDAQIFAPQLMRVTDWAKRAADPGLAVPWHTSQLWMSCDGRIAVTHGTWQRPQATGWFITVWQRQNRGGYKWVLEEGGTLTAAPAESDMISASVADCPARRAHGSAGELLPPDHGKVPFPDYSSGRADDGTLTWATTVAADGGRSFSLQLKQDGVLHEVLHAAAVPPGA